MSFTKNILFTIILLCSVTFGYSQIVTSKKEAVKKGIYQKPDTKVEAKNDIVLVTDKPLKKEKKKSESKSEKTRDRLKALITAKNGFELAEFDLAQRGAGELWGNKQWGVSDLAMEAIKNIKMVEVARLEAIRIVEEDFEFKKYPEIKKFFSDSTTRIHFE